MSHNAPLRHSPDAVFCRTTMNYVAARATNGGDLRPTEVDVRDGRRAALPGWQTCGFELRRMPSQVRDWDDDTAIAQVHYAEAAALAKTLTGCDHALVSGHIKRNPEEVARHPDLGPISYVHSDFAASYGDRMRDFYAGTGGEAQTALDRAQTTARTVANARRMMILQFWRNVGPAKMDLPLAFCDSRTVRKDEVRVFPVVNYAGGGFDFETLGVAAPSNPQQHHWYVFPEMLVDEVVVFRTFDSDLVTRGEAFWTPHSAFRDPTVPLANPSRRSVELRATCFFE